jgi:hypothetical protein
MFDCWTLVSVLPDWQVWLNAKPTTWHHMRCQCAESICLTRGNRQVLNMTAADNARFGGEQASLIATTGRVRLTRSRPLFDYRSRKRALLESLSSFGYAQGFLTMLCGMKTRSSTLPIATTLALK